MKKLITGISLLFVAIMMVSCTTGQNKTSGATVAENVNVQAFETHIQGAQLLDVRTPAEWNEGIIEGAIMANIYDADFEAQLAKLDKEKPVAVYCKSGGRSGQAMDKMKQMGFKEVYNLNGGIGAWNAADKPTVSP